MGLLKCGVLVMLKMSTRNSPLICAANVNSFAIVASRLTYRGPSITPFRGALPKVLFAGDEKTDVSNH